MAERTPPSFEELYPDKTPWGMFRAAFDPAPPDFSDNRLQAMARDSSLNLSRGYKQVFGDPNVSGPARASYVAGRLVHDIVNDGTRTPWWALNHPLALVSVLGDLAADAGGLNPDYREMAEKLESVNDFHLTRDNIDHAFAVGHEGGGIPGVGFSYRGDGKGVPLGLARKAPALVASAAMLASSGNSDFANITGGGRTKGFQSIFPSEGDDTRSSSPLLELGARYLFGRTGRLLDWEQFTEERPEVSPGDYGRYRAHQYDKGPLLGLIKATSRNLEGEPEYTMMGFRVPLSAAGATAGALGGSIAGSKIADDMISAQLQERFGPALKARGHRRLAGAIVGALSGAVAGNLTTKAVNRAVIQPMLNPAELAEQIAWEEQQRAAGLI